MMSPLKQLKINALTEFKGHRKFYYFLFLPTYVAMILNQVLMMPSYQNYVAYIQTLSRHTTQSEVISQSAATQHGNLWSYVASILLLSVTLAILKIIRNTNYQNPFQQSMTLFVDKYTVFKAFRVGLAKFVLMLAWTFLTILVAVFVAIFSFKINASLGIIVTILITMVGCGFIIYKQLQYSQAQLIAFDDTQIANTGFASVKASVALMNGRNLELLCLHLSFIGWWLLNAITFRLVGYFYLRPYLQLTVVKYYQQIVNN